jgi:hypothetical protein
MVVANAIVDVIEANTPVSLGLYRVEVWGRDPYDYTRHYEIRAQNDTMAAQEGIRRFVAEMEALPTPPN